MNNCRACRFEPQWEQFSPQSTLMVGRCQKPTLFMPDGLQPLLKMRGGSIYFGGRLIEACLHHLQLTEH